MKTISFQVSGEECELAHALIRRFYACCPGFDLSDLASLAMNSYCEELERKRGMIDAPPAGYAIGSRGKDWREPVKPRPLRDAVNVIPGPWKSGKGEA